MSALNDVLADLHAESEDLDHRVAALSPDEWATLTPAPGWTITHQIAHLAWTDEVSLISIVDPERFMELLSQAAADPGGFVEAGAQAGAQDSPGAILVRWRAGRAALGVALAEVPDGVKLPWFGTQMSAASMATARLMETWAHGQDVADALRIDREPTKRLRHIARLAVRTRDWAFGIRELDPPADEFRVELGAPDGEIWTWGPTDSNNRVAGPALDFCLLATQRRHRSDLALVATGAEADMWLNIAQAFAGPPGQGRVQGQFA
ncbi:MAG TPA: TIGR03084 family protein [Micromonosporaceae bacterium]|nr:TIGR03084 family protein [Micromonosporaceae bacterium]